MAKLSIHKVRQNIATANMNCAGLAADQKLKRAILSSQNAMAPEPALAEALAAQHRLVQKKQIDRAFAEVHGRRRTQKRTNTRRRKDYRSPEGFNQCGLEVGRSYASRAGERMERKKEGFPKVMRHPSTIDLCIVPVTGDLEEVSTTQRKGMRNAFLAFTDGAQIEGMFQIIMKTAEDLACIFPVEEWPEDFDPVARPHELFAKFHWHGDISDPQLDKQSVRRILKQAYPGKKRVCVRHVLPERLTKDGLVTAGAQGYLEYSAMDKVEIKFNEKELIRQATLSHARLASTWNKRNRGFSMGKSLAKSSIVIDECRVAELELMVRLDYVKSNFDKLSYAERFIHLWMSGAIPVARKKTSWTKLGDFHCNRIRAFLSLVKNWSTDRSFEDLCFFDYLDCALE